MASPSTAPRGARLRTAECWTLLQNAQLGRLALVDGDGVPEIYPVNFATHEGAVYLRTARDSKLRHLHTRPGAAFEIDGEDEHDRWSVVVRGTAAPLRDEDEIRDSGVMDVVSLTPTRKPYVIKITAHSVTGRRFPKGAPSTSGPRSAPTPSVTEPTGPSGPKRSQRPDPIPHHPPATSAAPTAGMHSPHHDHVPAPDEPSIPELEEDEDIAPRPEEEIADELRAEPDVRDHAPDQSAGSGS